MKKNDRSENASVSPLTPEQRIARIADLVAEMQHLQKHKPPNINDALARLEPLTEELRTLVGADIASIVNSFGNVRPESYEEKRFLSKRLNDLFDGFGLRVKCPKTGKGASIQTKTHSQGHREGIFQLQISGNIGTASSMALPKIELIPRDMCEKPRGLGGTTR
jgi:hypothetical protein